MPKASNTRNPLDYINSLERRTIVNRIAYLEAKIKEHHGPTHMFEQELAAMTKMVQIVHSHGQWNANLNDKEQDHA